MADHSHRPVYVPRGRRRTTTPTTAAASAVAPTTTTTTTGGRKRGRGGPGGTPYFHGAFTGGFSAGHFNTVGSQEGWQPLPSVTVGTTTTTREEEEEEGDDDNDDGPRRLRHPQPPLQQRPEDFMDEHDHSEWGGPIAARSDFRPPPATAATATTSASKASASSWAVVVPPQNVGRRFLRLWGWRERDGGGGTAYVPDDDIGRDGAVVRGSGGESGKTRRWRHVRHPPAPLALPPPKLDVAGVGYEPFAGAPEFRKHRQRLEQLARDRATAASAGNRRNTNVYRVSDALDAGRDGGGRDTYGSGSPGGAIGADGHENEDRYRSYEAAEDLVGRRTFGGFALRDDEDDAYDDVDYRRRGAGGADRDEFDTELDVDRDASSDDDGNYQGPGGVASATVGGTEGLEATAGGVFAAWARTSTPAGAPAALGSDGRPPLERFVWASASAAPTRYRGPDVPPHYEVVPHTFGPDDHPLAHRARSRGEHWRLHHERHQTLVAEALQGNAVVRGTSEARSQRVTAHTAAPPGQLLMPGRAAFAGIGAAMRNRFTSGSTESETTTEAHLPAGDGVPNPPVRVVRTVSSFAPEPLLCKRFGVPVPGIAGRGGGDAAVTVNAVRRTKEEAFFQDEVLGRLAGNAGNDTAHPAAAAADAFDTPRPEPSMGPPQPHPGSDRPPDDAFRSIFDPHDYADDNSNNSDHDMDKNNNDHDKDAGSPPSRDDARPLPETTPPPEMTPAAAPTTGMPSLLAPPAASAASDEDRPDGEGRGSESDNRRRPDRHRRRKSRHRDEPRRRRRRDSEEEDDVPDYYSSSPSTTSHSTGARKRKKRKKDKKRRKDRRERKAAKRN